ncbi:MAG: hypothetical protein DBX59_01150 [Bacillota bacterium]|nr:MAG: hypothetical protein DBX59_01150 [Bacillota bacterium]
MGKRFDSLIFPGGKSKVFTLSYDDGVVQDRRLAQLLRQYGVKCTFNLGSALLGHPDMGGFPGKPDLDISKVSPEEIPTVYATHEVAGHSLYHSSLDKVGAPLAAYEIAEDKRRLEALVGKPLRMFAYPFGMYTPQVVELLRLCGYQGARTIRSSHSFDIPQNFLEWDPTCHHDDPQLMELARQFVEGPPFFPMLFYVWGHAYEFDDEDNWSVMENLAAYLAEHKDKIWFATNGEILEYVTAYRRLEYSVDGSLIYNPSAIDVIIRTSMEQTELLKAGCCTRIAQTPL